MDSMEPIPGILAMACQVARQLSVSTAAHQAILPPEILAGIAKIPPSQFEHALAMLIEMSRACIDQTPREAWALARIAYELANTRVAARTQAETGLLLAGALNRLGEFSAALPLCHQAAERFAKCEDAEDIAHSLCEAAWAYTFIGDLSRALATTERARAVTLSLLIHARCDWIQARVLRDQSHYPEAIALFEKAREVFQANQLPLDALRCERESAHTRVLGESEEAMDLLERLQGTFRNGGCALDAALCDYFFAVGLGGASRYLEALNHLLGARRTFADLESGFFAAWCDLWSGVVYRHLNHFDESLRASHQARDYFLAHGISMEVSACDINLGNAYSATNRYDEALALYQEAADLALAEGRETRAARIYSNLGLVYAKQGLYSKSLDLHHRALQISTSKNLPVLAANNYFALAACYRQLGQFADALTCLKKAREAFALHHIRDQVAVVDIELAEGFLAQGELADAVTCLGQARSVGADDGLDSIVAVCDRLLAQAAVQSTGRENAVARVENARALFLKHAQFVDAALCDLTEGELRLVWNDHTAAADCFQRARAVLSPAFPDHAWRADYGLGRCAAASGDGAAAHGCYLNAVRTIAASRSALVTEQISNDFFARRQSVFDDALSIALQQRDTESVLEVIEASKARTFLTLLQNRGWKQRSDRDDPYIAALIAREKELRYQLAKLRGRVVVEAAPEVGEALRGGKALDSISAAALQELDALSRAYESVVTQLQLGTIGLAGVSVPAPFAFLKFRDATNAAFGTDWTALDYYLAHDTLTIVAVSPTETHVERKVLSTYDRAILEQCTASEPDLRELIYRGTLRGVEVPSSGRSQLRRLYSLLIPQGLGTTLIISPHGVLHRLPFHALMDDAAFLVERQTLLYVPCLQALQLLTSKSGDSSVMQPLVVGISNFGDHMRPLPSAAVEADRVRQAFGGIGESLLEGQATRRKLLELDASGELQKFDVLHFATHAILDRAAPHQSGVILADDTLTVMDILDLSLDARLVTLSACQTALGEDGRGDELVDLARAFFYAGARALLATLWHVEDPAMAELTGWFYRYLTQGENAAVALRKAQIEMIRVGRPAYQWASFALIGRP